MLGETEEKGTRLEREGAIRARETQSTAVTRMGSDRPGL